MYALHNFARHVQSAPLASDEALILSLIIWLEEFNLLLLRMGFVDLFKSERNPILKLQGRQEQYLSSCCSDEYRVRQEVTTFADSAL